MSGSVLVTEVELRMVRMDLAVPFQSSTHAASALNHTLIRIQGRLESGALVDGWGEVSAPNDPYYVGETAENSWQVLRDFLVPKVLGQQWSTAAEFIDLYASVKANTFARAGLECAAWDLLCTARGESLSTALGGTRTEILSGVALGMEQDEILVERIGHYVREGYRRIKVKIAPGKDVETLDRIRQIYPTLAIMADANSAYNLSDLEALKALDKFNLTMIEQPLAFDDFVDHARVQAILKTPICLDESIRSLNDAKTAIALGSCKVMNIKFGRVGGLIEAKLIHDACVAANMPVWCGGMHEYGVGRAAAIALASLPGFTIPGDISGSDKYFSQDIVEPPIVARNGAITVPSVPGNGFSPHLARIAGKTIKGERFTLSA